MVKKYIPKQGDIVYIDFNPIRGHEQKGKRPAIVVSKNVFNKNMGMIMVCPITSNNKYFPTHYKLLDSKKINGSILCEHIRSVDYESRNVIFIEKASEVDLVSALVLINACIE